MLSILASLNELDAAHVSCAPHHVAILLGFEPVKGQNKFKGGGMIAARVNGRSITPEVHDGAGMNAAYTRNMN